jgi:hypothetical protein
MDCYLKATHVSGHLEIALSASLAPLATTKGETNVVRAQLAASDAKVTSKFFKIILYLITLFC